MNNPEQKTVNIDKLVRARRRTVGLQIASDGALTVRVPLKMSLHDVHRIVETRKGWIIRKQESLLKRWSDRVQRTYTEGELFLLLGATYPMVVDRSLRKIVFDGAVFKFPEKDCDTLRKLFQKWYMTRAFEVIEARCRHFSGLMGLKMPTVSIGRAGSRWGMCNSRGSLRFCYRLVMAPPEVVDLLVVHELSHIRVRNHSSDFYREMSRWLPEHKAINRWLTRNSHLLDQEIIPRPKLPPI